MNINKGKTVLLVDDDVFSSCLLSEDLELEGFDVLTASTLNEAKDIIISNQINVAVIDIMLPIGEGGAADQKDLLVTMGGFRSGQVLAARIKKNYPDVILIAYTNSEEIEVKDWFDKNGARFFSKTGNRRSDVVKYICKATGMAPPGPKCFIVHGHDEESRYQLKDYLQNILKFPEPIVLQEQPSGGRTIIEKFEEVSMDVDLVFILLTPDDIVSRSDDINANKRRARQNVIFEMGYFLAKFGRKRGRVILLCKGDIELPSDIAGWARINISNGIASVSEEIRRELGEFLP
jgi:CheY-like chemotaxis protein